MSKLVLLGLVFVSIKPKDWQGRTSPKLPILCGLGRKTLNQLLDQCDSELLHTTFCD